jgi:sugar lactone lactonase YvrE
MHVNADGIYSIGLDCYNDDLNTTMMQVDVYDSSTNYLTSVYNQPYPLGASQAMTAGGDYFMSVQPLASGTDSNYRLIVQWVGPISTPTQTPTVTSTDTPVINVTTLAGSGDTVPNDGPGIGAGFQYPQGVAVDASGNVYVADRYNYLIRKITSGGDVTTLAGQVGVTGSINGTGTAASFNNPQGVAVDGSGNVYVADQGNNLIRKITSGGDVTTLAGQAGVTGSTDGAGTVASFNYPIGVAVDASGNVYVGDEGNNLIRKITSGGNVTTLAGSGSVGSTNGIGTAAKFYHPYGVAVDALGNVYVADQGNDLIRKITSGGLVTTLAGTGSGGASNGTGTAASFFWPQGVAVDPSGNVYVADSSNNLIRKITSGGVVTTLAGSGTADYVDGIGIAASFNNPTGVAVDSSGNVYVADFYNLRIREITQ